ncbi:MAG: polysaccharide biosynthesis protein [Clostridia bacterium]|nr:polysaccharide biosynthesis protein [Clostridia bacterium]
MKRTAQTITRGFLILSVANISVKLISLVFVPLIKHLLNGYAGYSVYSSAYSVYAFVYVIATAGFPVAISKIVSELSAKKQSDDAKRAFSIATRLLVALGFVLTVVIMACAKPLARLLSNKDSWAGIMVLGPTVFVCAVLSGFRGYFQGRRNMRPTAVSQIIEQIVHVLFSAAGVLLLRSKGIVWAVAGASLGTFAGSLVALAICLIEYKSDRVEFAQQIDHEKELRTAGHKGLTDSDLVKKILFYSLPLFISSAVQFGGDLIDNGMIKSSLLRAGFEESSAKILHGQYMAMRQLINVPGSLATALCVSVLPAITLAFAENNMRDVSKKSQNAFKLCYMAAVPIAAIYAVFSGPIYRVLGYGDNIILLSLSSFSVVFLCTVHLQSSILQGVNKFYTSSAFMCLCVILKAVLNYVLVGIKGLNIYGAIIATYVSYLIPLLLNLYVMKKRAGIRFSIIRAFAPTVAASATGVLIGYPVYALLRFVIRFAAKGYISYLIAIIPAGIVTLVVYYVSLRKLGGLTSKDLGEMSPKIRSALGKADRFFKIKN